MSSPTVGHRSPSLGVGSAVLAFDVGGTDMKVALVDEAGSIRDLVRVRTPTDGGRTADAIVTRIGELAAELLAGHPGVRPLAAGLLVPGYVDEDAGVGVFAKNFGWSNFPFRDRAQHLLGVPVSFSHDVRGAGEAEFRLGAAAPFRDVVFMAIGTGIAGAIFIHGTLYTGRGQAGEMGHSKVADGPVCACGGGCLEAVASAGARAENRSPVRRTCWSGRRQATSAPGTSGTVPWTVSRWTSPTLSLCSRRRPS